MKTEEFHIVFVGFSHTPPTNERYRASAVTHPPFDQETAALLRTAHIVVVASKADFTAVAGLLADRSDADRLHAVFVPSLDVPGEDLFQLSCAAIAVYQYPDSRLSQEVLRQICKQYEDFAHFHFSAIERALNEEDLAQEFHFACPT